MSTSHLPQRPFVDRFERLFARARRVSLGSAICWTALLTTVGFIWLTAADYLLEIEHRGRVIGLGLIVVGGLLLALLTVIYSIRQWTARRTVARLEQRFPQLGQSVRTSVEYGKRNEADLRGEGIDVSLVQALTSDTQSRSASLPLERIVPINSFLLAAGAAALTLGLIAIAAGVDWQWRTATSRALLADTPYSEVIVSPGSLTIDEGESVALEISVLGRTDRQIMLLSRSLRDPEQEWLETELSDEDMSNQEPRKVSYRVPLAKIEEPLEYRVTAGPAVSDTHVIKVRYPLEIRSIAAHVTPPQYTGVEPSLIEEGNLHVIDGSQVKLEIELDRQPREASMIVRDFGTASPGETLGEQRIEFEVNSSTLTTTLELTDDKTYSIFATSHDGMSLAENQFRIRVRHDQSPQVWFEEPRESLEVHSLAEVMLRIRARDDFGLTRSGIVFEVNNEQELTLLEKDYRELVAEMKAAGEVVGNQTRDALQRLLPLEFFNLTQKDSVTFYAFAEDNLPGQAHRTETDLQFIDIRPFKRLYRLPDPAMENMSQGNQGPQVRFLQEIINRQRFNLNRTIRLGKRVAAGEQAALSMVDRTANFEDDLASSTRQLAEYLREFDFEDLDLLFQAETSMLAAVDSLGVGKYEISTQQQKDALRLLIEGRNSIEIQLRKATNGQRNALNQFDNMQLQKLRRENDDSETEDPERVVDQIRQLAARQGSLSGSMQSMTEGEGGGSSSASESEPENETAEATAGEANQEDDQEMEANEEDANTGEETDDPAESDAAGDQEQSDESMPDMNAAPANEPAEMTRQQVEAEQQDIALEAREIETTLNRNLDISNLAQERASEAADMADQAAGELIRGSTEEAAETAEQTATALRELALNVEGLLAEEATRKIAISRDLAGGLSRAERELSKELEQENEGTPEEMSPEESPPGAGALEEEEEPAAMQQRAAQLAETGKTMEDILNSVAETNSPQAGEAIRRIEEILAEGELSETVERMESLAGMLAAEEQDVPLEAGAIADQLDSTARQLDNLYRVTVTPRTEQLMQLEQQAAALAQGLQELETNQEITSWHAEAMELLDEVDQARAAQTAPDDLYEEMQQGRANRKTSLDWDWNQDDNGLQQAPDGYVKAAEQLVQELQQHIQEVILTDMASDRDQAAPPRYRHMIDRYLEVLSAEVE